MLERPSVGPESHRTVSACPAETLEAQEIREMTPVTLAGRRKFRALRRPCCVIPAMRRPGAEFLLVNSAGWLTMNVVTPEWPESAGWVAGPKPAMLRPLMR